MDVQTLQQFFMWCTVINGALYFVTAVMCAFAGDWIYAVQSRWFPMSKQTFTIALYGYLGAYKILFILFN